MNTVKLIGMCLAFVLAVVGMSLFVASALAKSDKSDEVLLLQGGILTDLETGCQYVKFGGSITPRMNPDGTQVCLKTL